MLQLFSLTAPILGLLLAGPAVAPIDDDQALSAKEQETLLATRVNPWITNNFSATCSLMFSFENVAIHTHSKDLSDRRVYSPFPAGYKPTWRECFDTVAHQVTCTWAYDPELTYWVFTPIDEEDEDLIKLPFLLDMPDGWTAQRIGNRRSLRSENKHALVEVYTAGSYSTDETKAKKRAAFFDDVRDKLATRQFAQGQGDYDLEDAALVDFAGYEARYQEKLPRDDGYMWREWVVVAEGQCFIVQSTTTAQFDEVLAIEVQRLLEGFEVAE